MNNVHDIIRGFYRGCLMKDFILGGTMSAYRIVALPGDGTGREVMREALKVLDVFQKHGPVDFDIREIPCLSLIHI